MPHVHIGAQEWLTWLLFFVATCYLWRQTSVKLAQSDQPLLHTVGEAMGVIF